MTNQQYLDAMTIKREISDLKYAKETADELIDSMRVTDDTKALFKARVSEDFGYQIERLEKQFADL